jgi:replication factor C subunit 1
MSISKYFAPVKKISSTLSQNEKRTPQELPSGSKQLKNKSKFFDQSSSSDTEVLPEEPKVETVKKSKISGKTKSPQREVPKIEVKPEKKTEQKPEESEKNMKKEKKPTKNSKKDKKNKEESKGIQGKTFVITGVLHNFSRESLTDQIKELGGKVTGNVSRNTSYLIHGLKLEDGRDYKLGNKYKKALELNTKILDEEGITKLLEECTQNNQESEKSEEAIKPKSKAEKFTSPQSQSPSTRSSDLWTEKYSPRSSQDLLGNSQSIEKLQIWLETWEQEVLLTPSSKGPKPKSTENSKARAALISGPPGIGKTTACRLLSLESGFKVMEMNASDIRSKKQIQDLVSASSVSHSLTMQGDIVKNLIIMDEVDGMSAGDRGGVAALIQVIKSTRNPIICICNDRQSPKIKSLINYCYDIRFSKPNKLQVTRRMVQILRNEGIQVEPNAVEFFVETTGNDIRQVLTAFDMWSRNYGEMTYMQAKNRFKTVQKDTTCMVSNFEAASRLFNSTEMKRLTHKERIDLAFIDYDLIPLIVQENYLNALDSSDLRKMQEAADSIALADLMSKEIYANGNWSLLPSYLQESCIHPTQLCRNLVPFTKFPEFYAKSSTTRKKERLAKELHIKFSSFTNCAVLEIVNEYVPLIQKLVTSLLEQQDFYEAAETLNSLNLDPETFKENIIGLSLNDEDFKSLSSSSKKNLTLAFNKHFSSSIEKVKGSKKEDPEFQDISEIEESEEEPEIEVKAKATILSKKKNN